MAHLVFFFSFSNFFHSFKSLAYSRALMMSKIRRPIRATPATDPATMAMMFGGSGHPRITCRNELGFRKK